MARYPTGQPVRLSTTVRDLSGTLVNPGALALTIQKSDGTTLTPYSSPATTGTGLFYQDVPAADIATVDHYQYKWVSTGTGAGVSYGSFDVFDPLLVTAPPLVDPDEMRSLLQLSATDLPDDQAWLVLNAVSGDIRREAGWSITQETGVTFTRDAPYGPDIFLPTMHLTVVTSVTVDGTLLQATGYEWNQVGRLTRLAGVWWRRSIKQLANVVVVVTHGYPPGQIPNSVKSLCLEHAARRLDYPAGIAKGYRVDIYQETPVVLPGIALRIEDDPRVPRVPGVA